MERRRFLWSTGAALAALLGGFRLPSPGPGDAPRRPLLQRLHSARAVGARALACGLSARAADALPAALQPARARGTRMRDELERRIRDDFARGDTLVVDGWVLSRSEALLCAATYRGTLIRA